MASASGCGGQRRTDELRRLGDSSGNAAIIDLRKLLSAVEFGAGQMEKKAPLCKRPRVGCGGYPDADEPARFIFTRRGSSAVHVGSRTFFARPGQVILLQKNVEYRITHPDLDGCDCCTDVWIDDAMLESLGMTGATASPCREFSHDLQFQKTHVEMLIGLRHGGDAMPDEAEEVLLDTLDCLLQSYAPVRAHTRHSGMARQVARVEGAIIGHAGKNLDVHVLAKLAGCSPFHLYRIFRSRTGQSL